MYYCCVFVLLLLVMDDCAVAAVLSNACNRAARASTTDRRWFVILLLLPPPPNVRPPPPVDDEAIALSFPAADTSGCTSLPLLFDGCWNKGNPENRPCGYINEFFYWNHLFLGIKTNRIKTLLLEPKIHAPTNNQGNFWKFHSCTYLRSTSTSSFIWSRRNFIRPRIRS